MTTITQTRPGRAGQSAVVADSGTGKTQMLAGLGASLSIVTTVTNSGAGRADGVASVVGAAPAVFHAGAGQADGAASVAGHSGAIRPVVGNADGQATVLGVGLNTFPTFNGIGWPVIRKPTFRTVVASHPTGAEVRTALWTYPLWEFETTFDALLSDNSYPGAVGGYTLQKLMGFFLSLGGGYGQFLWIDPDFNSFTLANVGVGDGATTAFTCTRAMGGFVEPISFVTAVSQVTVAGSVVGGWSLSPPNQIVFGSAPASGALIAASYTYGFMCRFLEDTLDFEETMSNLWLMKSLKFRQVRTQ